jgi:chromosomal replication initiator protein
LGKTHLLHAIGNEYLLTHPAASVKYIPAGEFIREVYNSLSQGSANVEALKDQYTNYDLLLVDDTQFLAKKEKMNEIFFHIFNKNISRGKLIVMTSDKPPGSLEGFEDRIKSRFGSGLSIVITPPDMNSMCAILQEKIKEGGGGIILTHDAMDYVVRRNNKDIRRLEGYLHRVLFYAINNLPPNCIITTEIIQNNIDKLEFGQEESRGYDFDPNMIIEKICSVYNVDASLVKSKIRTKQISLVRNVCMFALRDKFKISLESVGVLFGRHHTTVMDSIDKINKLLKQDNNLKQFITQLYKNM